MIDTKPNIISETKSNLDGQPIKLKWHNFASIEILKINVSFYFMYQFSLEFDYENDHKYRFDLYRGDFSSEDVSKASQSYGIILNEKDEIVISYNGKTGHWLLPGGTVEEGETIIETLKREVYEEAAVVVDEKSLKPVYYQKVYKILESGEEIYDTLQARYIGKAQRIDTFMSDPAGKMTHVKWVSGNELPNYLKWGQTTDLIISIINDYLN